LYQRIGEGKRERGRGENHLSPRKWVERSKRKKIAALSAAVPKCGEKGEKRNPGRGGGPNKGLWLGFNVRGL